MSQAASQAAAFYREVASGGSVWTIRDAGGVPAPLGTGGCRSMPFWSSEARVAAVIRNVPAYADFSAEQLGWTTFRDRWLPGLERDGILVGVNWTGSRATGFDVEPQVVRQAIENLLQSDRT
jgi:uncharacterized protein DUF2750